MSAYYNEFDRNAAAWLRELIKKGLIADGEVDERSIVDVRPSDLTGFTQCHFFAGIGVWSHSLRRAGWSDDTPVWTGSCPCQPFSAAGAGAGFDDERHLWPAFHWLITQCRPPVVYGEQVASKAGLGWLDLVQADLEGSGYASAAADLCAAGIGAPHIRQRLFWVAKRLADTDEQQWDRSRDAGARGGREPSDGWANGRLADTDADGRHEGLQSLQGGRAERAGSIGEHQRLGHANDQRPQEYGGSGNVHIRISDWPDPGRQHIDAGVSVGLADTAGRGTEGRHEGEPEDMHDRRAVGGLADTDGRNPSEEREQRGGEQRQQPEDGGVCPDTGAGEADSFWRDADWLFCRDGKWRPVRSGTFPLVNGSSARVGRLRGYGNAIVAPITQAFIEATM